MTAEATYFIPVSNGIFAHCRRIGAAVWVFMWLIDHVTREEPGEDGHAEGLVYGGRSLRAREIALDLGVTTRTVQEHLDRLVSRGYLRRLDSAKGLCSGYAVLRSKKWHRLASVAGELEPGETSGTPQESARVRKNPRGVRGKTAQVRGNLPPYIETRHNNTQTKEHVVLTDECVTPSELPLKAPAALAKTPKAPKAAKATVPDAVVEELYREYPRHVKRPEAKKAIGEAIVRVAKVDGISEAEAAEKLLARVRNYSAYVKRVGLEMRYCPYPATWFNGERYDDDDCLGRGASNTGTPKYTDPATLYSGPEYQDGRRLA